MSIAAEPLRRLVAEIFRRAGCPPEEAERVARYLVKANLTGHDSHGVIRVPRYVAWIEEGRLVPGRHVEVVLETPVIAVLDGGHGMGQTVGPEATAIGIRKAREHGLSAVALRNAGHLGRIGDFAEMAIAAGLVSIHFVNVYNSLLVAPFGGASRRFSTNPVAIGVPTGDEGPFVLDFATALVAEGKVLVAHQGGKPVPPDALVDEHGRLTNDPRALYGDAAGRYPDPTLGKGALRTFGEHKGSGLALACELLAGALTGSGVNTGGEGPVHNGMLSLFLDPQRFGVGDHFLEDVRRFVAWVKSAKPVDPVEGVLIPGDKERRTEAERLAHGIPLSEETFRAIVDTARRLGLSDGEIRELLED
ncbi:putative oxidoreductase YbiC [bacterium HR40]|nr:putative oxidoreductase YbiC [bacterium HR40]